MPDFSSETACPLKQAAKLFPHPPSLQTLWRWASRGVRGVTLETFRQGGKRFTTREAVDRFLHACNKPGVCASPRTPSTRETERTLIAAGIACRKPAGRSASQAEDRA